MGAAMKVAVLGATGLVGRTMIALLAERAWADDEPLLLASRRSAGARLPFRGREVACQDAAASTFAGVRVALFSAGAAASRTYAPAAAAAGCWVVDNSSAWRMEAGIPLVVPEVNPGLVPALAARPGGPGGIIANPNCSTIQIAAAVAPLRDAFGLREVHVTTLQAASGAGGKAVAELVRQVEADGVEPGRRLLRGELRLGVHGPGGEPGTGDEPGAAPVFPRHLAGNAIPAIGPGRPDGSYEEEAKVDRELRKILDQDELQVTCTAVRVPVWNGHAAAVRAVLGRAVPREEIVAALAARAGLAVSEDPLDYPTQRQTSGSPAVAIGRVRLDPRQPAAVLMWVVADNVLKGAAWNAVQIGDLLAGGGRDAGRG